MKFIPKKTIFKIDYQPKLSFYEKLFQDLSISKKFPHWQTDRLKITFKDFDFHHSLTISYNNIVFESDKYEKAKEREIIDLLVSEILKIVDDDTFTRFGMRRFFLIKQEMSFKELVEIIKLKCFSSSFVTNLNENILDATITVDSEINGNKVKITLGPMIKSEIPRFIQYNVDNHISPDTMTRVNEIERLFSSYPEVSLYIDIDYSMSSESMKKADIVTFLDQYERDVSPLLESIVDDLFKEKVK